MRAIISFAILLIALVYSPAEAKVFRNAYVSFELPPKWDCVLEGTEWVCRSTFDSQAAREAIIILTAKEVGPADSLAAYESHLKTTRTLPSKQGIPVQSKLIKVEPRNIANQTWIDGLHLSSEVPNYYTRYMATVKDRIAILVTFSAHSRVYSKYAQDFFRAISSLRVTTSKGLVNPQAGLRPGSETLGVNIQSQLPTDLHDEYPAEASTGEGSGLTGLILGLAVLLAAAGVYLLMKQKKSSKKR